MNRLWRSRKRTRGEPEEPSINIFLIVVAVAGALIVCFLLYALLAPVLLGDGDDEPQYEVVPYGGEPTFTPMPALTWAISPTIPVVFPTFAPTPTPALAAPAAPITLLTAPRVGIVAQLAGHSNPVSRVVFSPDGRFIASGDRAGLVKLWSAPIRAELYTFRSASNRVDSLAFNPDSTQLAAAGQDTYVRLWDLSTGSELTPLSGPSGAVTSLAYSRALLAAGSDDGKVYLWNMPGGVMLGVLSGHTSYVTSVVFSPDGSILAAGGEDDTIWLWSLPGGNPLGVLRGHTSTVTGLAFSPDGTTLASTSADHSVRLWNVLSQSQVAALSGHTENVNGVAFSPDGTLIASAAGGIEDNTVRLWNARTGEQLRVLYPGGPANGVVFSPDGLWLVAGGATFVTLWGVTDTPQVIVTPTPAPSPFVAIITPGGEACVLTARLNDVNLRGGPGTVYNVVGKLALNQQVQAIGWITGEEGFTWWQLTNGAWARGDAFIDTTNQTLPDACLRLAPVSQVPPTPLVTSPPPTQAAVVTGTPATCILTARVNDANVRSAPDDESGVLIKLTLNQQVQVVGWTTGDEGFTWWKLFTGGWARGDVFVDAANPNVPDACLGLPLVEP
jgi:WD40 repeat protein